MRARAAVLVVVALLVGCGQSDGRDAGLAASAEPLTSTTAEPAPVTTAPTSTAPPTTTDVTTPPAPTTTAAPAVGRAEGTVVVREGAARSHLYLMRDDAQVASFETATTSPFAFESLPPATYRLDHEVTSPVETAPDGSQTSSASYSRGEPFELGAGATVRFTCDRGCTRT